MVPVTAVMRQGPDLPVVDRSTDLIDLLAVMSAKRMGAACVLDADGVLAGLVVDGDVRRHLQSARRMAGVTAGELMRRDPRVVGQDATIGDVLARREGDGPGWLVLPVVDAARRLKGMVHLHDLDGGAA
jgi:arabinose-5-phosphate isomerase